MLWYRTHRKKEEAEKAALKHDQENKQLAWRVSVPGLWGHPAPCQDAKSQSHTNRGPQQCTAPAPTHPIPPPPTPGLVYWGQVLLGVISHIHLGYTRCLCRGLGRIGQSTVLPSWSNLCRGCGNKAVGQGRVGACGSVSTGTTKTEANSVGTECKHYHTKMETTI